MVISWVKSLQRVKVIWTNDSTEPDNYTAPPKEGNVTFKKNSVEPDGYQPEDKFATVHYTVSVDGSSIEGLSDKKCSCGTFWQYGNVRQKKESRKKVRRTSRADWQWLMMKRVYLTREN